MLQDKQQIDTSELNLEDVKFAEKNKERVKDDWNLKFLLGSAEHGGIGKPSLVERKGLIREALNEHYDGISYTLAIEQRLNKARAILSVILRNGDGNLSEGQIEDLSAVIELLS